MFFLFFLSISYFLYVHEDKHTYTHIICSFLCPKLLALDTFLSLFRIFDVIWIYVQICIYMSLHTHAHMHTAVPANRCKSTPANRCESTPMLGTHIVCNDDVIQAKYIIFHVLTLTYANWHIHILTYVLDISFKFAWCVFVVYGDDYALTTNNNIRSNVCMHTLIYTHVLKKSELIHAHVLICKRQAAIICILCAYDGEGRLW